MTRSTRFLAPALRVLAASVLVLFVAHAALAAGPSHHPGFVDGSFLKEFASDDGEFVEVTLDGNVLKMFAGPASSIEQSVGDIVSRLESIRALVLELRDDVADDAVDRVEEIRDRLERDGWQQIARVRDGESRVNVMFKMSENVIHGITVLVLDGKDLVFTNIAGDLREEDLKNLTERFSVPGMYAIGAPGGHGHEDDDDHDGGHGDHDHR